MRGMQLNTSALVLSVAAGMVTTSAAMGAIAPYTADANTVALYHFDEVAGSADPGNPFVNYGSGGTTLNLSNTGGPDGRDNTGGGGYGRTAVQPNFGAAFSSRGAGDNTYHGGSTGSTTGGGALTAGAVTQASLQGANGAFTYEALVMADFDPVSGNVREQTIISHDGDGSNRGFMLRLLYSTSNRLGLFYTTSTNTTSNIYLTLPGSGDANALVAGAWYHVAAAYTGDEGVNGNLSFYWTRVSDDVTQANLLGTATLANDLTSLSDGNRFGVGGITRLVYRFEPVAVDEVRISNIARGPGDFVFVPEPTSLAVLAIAGMGLIRRPRKA